VRLAYRCIKTNWKPTGWHCSDFTDFDSYLDRVGTAVGRLLENAWFAGASFSGNAVDSIVEDKVQLSGLGPCPIDDDLLCSYVDGDLRVAQEALRFVRTQAANIRRIEHAMFMAGNAMVARIVKASTVLV